VEVINTTFPRNNFWRGHK